MEAFPAADEDQFNFIKRIIEDTDYYVLLLGARYGSLATDGVGFTEKEYRYAMEKEIPVLAFVHSSPQEVDAGKSDLSDPSIAEKFYRFRNEITGNRMVKMWEDSSTLPAFVVLALNQAFADRPRVGWTRGATIDSEQVLHQLVETQAKLETAENELRDLRGAFEIRDDVADLSVELSVTVELWSKTDYSSVRAGDITVSLVLERLFSLLGPNIIEPLNQDSVSNILAIEAAKGEYVHRPAEHKYRLERESLNTVRIQLEALGLIQVRRAKAVNESIYNYWSLTEYGISEVRRLRIIRAT